MSSASVEREELERDDDDLGYRWFDERDCSGVWDGFEVVSDADPGL
jgi:hypothetical protein